MNKPEAAAVKDANGELGPAKYELNLFNSHAQTVKSAEDCGWLLMELVRSTIEKSVVVFTDDQGVVLAVENVGIGWEDGVFTHAETLENALRAHEGKNAWHVHNHPNGTCTPSPDDFKFKKWFEKTCGEMNVKPAGSAVIARCGVTAVGSKRFTEIEWPCVIERGAAHHEQMDEERQIITAKMLEASSKVTNLEAEINREKEAGREPYWSDVKALGKLASSLKLRQKELEHWEKMSRADARAGFRSSMNRYYDSLPNRGR